MMEIASVLIAISNILQRVHQRIQQPLSCASMVLDVLGQVAGMHILQRQRKM
jgi:hypothetical protein